MHPRLELISLLYNAIPICSFTNITIAMACTPIINIVVFNGCLPVDPDYWEVTGEPKCPDCLPNGDLFPVEDGAPPVNIDPYHTTVECHKVTGAKEIDDDKFLLTVPTCPGKVILKRDPARKGSLDEFALTLCVTSKDLSKYGFHASVVSDVISGSFTLRGKELDYYERKIRPKTIYGVEVRDFIVQQEVITKDKEKAIKMIRKRMMLDNNPEACKKRAKWYAENEARLE
jgi:hypothetical protein